MLSNIRLGTLLACVGGAVALVLSFFLPKAFGSYHRIVEVIFTLIALIGAFIIIRSDKRNRPYFIIMLLLMALLLLVPFIDKPVP